jgi:hypothetical protein
VTETFEKSLSNNMNGRVVTRDSEGGEGRQEGTGAEAEEGWW